MKNYFTSLFSLAAILSSFSVVALQRDTPQEPASLYEHMNEVNAEWIHINPDDYSEIISFRNEDERIHTHLIKVIDYLNVNEPDVFSVNQLNRRRHLLSQLSSYADAQVFPMNIYHAQRTPYFIDHRGVHCAVGYLILQSGEGVLAQAISSAHNYDYIKDITTEGLSEWAKNHGFTIDELKWIQPGYPPAQQMSPVGTGTNGPVTVMTDISTTNELVFGGSFDMLDGIPCNNVGSWNGEQLTCLGQGVVGQINDISSASNNPYLVGLFDFEGDQYPLAKFDGGGWEYHYIPERLDVEGTAVLKVGGFGVEAEVVIQISENESELWYLMTDGSWALQASFNGVVEKIKASSYGRIYGGAFSEVLVEGTMIPANNIIIKENYEDNWFTLEGEVSDHIYAIETIGQSVFIGGAGTEGSDVVLSRYLNGSLQTLLAGANTIYDIKFNNESGLVLAGDLIFTDLGFTFGSHLATLDLISNSVVPSSVLDAPSFCISSFQNELYFGGEFTEDLSITVNHLGKFSSSPNSLAEISKEPIKIYPNPANHILKVELTNVANGTLELVSSTGQTVFSTQISEIQSGEMEIDVAELARGLYYLKLSKDGAIATSKVVLE